MAEAPCDQGCVFCRIVAGEIPCHKLYEDDHVLAMLDIGPLSRGHCLVMPKGHWVTLDQVPAPVGGAIGQLLPRLSRAVAEATQIRAWNVLQNNGQAAHQAVDHVHFHIIPKPDNASGLGITWPAGKLADDDARELLKKIGAAL